MKLWIFLEFSSPIEAFSGVAKFQGAVMGSPQVSVLIPTYNRANYLGAAIESVLEQTYRDLELIVVDDGSTDGTAALLGTIEDDRLHIVCQDNRGIDAALNAGLAIARGEFIARNDSDDVWNPSLLSTLVPILERNPDVGMVYGRSEGMDAKGMRLPELRGYPLRYPDDPLRSLLHADYTSSISTVVRRSSLEQIGGWDESAGCSGDWDMAIRIAARCRVVFVDRFVARFRRHAGNVTVLRSSQIQSQLDARKRVLDKLFASPGLSPAVLSTRASAYRNFYIGSGHQWIQLGNYAQALHYYNEALRQGPSKVATTGRILWSFLQWFVMTRIPGATRVEHQVLRVLRGGVRFRRGKCSEGTE